jgi:hypothetical protein
LGSAGRDPTGFFGRHFQLSVELATNSFPANYFVPKIYERKKSEKKRGINTLLRQIRTARAEEYGVRRANLRAAETLRLDGADEPPEFGEEAVDSGERRRGRRCCGASLSQRRRMPRRILTRSGGQALQCFLARGRRRAWARRRRGDALGTGAQVAECAESNGRRTESMEGDNPQV